MTRGTFYLYLENEIYSTTEFNGDMYFEGHGEDAARMMLNVNNLEDFQKMEIEFNRKHHNYPEEEMTLVRYTPGRYTYEEMLDMETDYFKKFFSDYIYIKNLSGRTLIFNVGLYNEDYEKEGYVKKALPNGASGVLNFGSMTDDFGSLNAFCEPDEVDANKPQTTLFNYVEECVGRGTDLIVTKEDVAEIVSLLDSLNEYPQIRFYKNMEEVARETAIRENKLQDWAIPYFDFDGYLKDIEGNMDLHTLPSGLVVEFLS